MTTTKATKVKIRVQYCRGTTECSGHAYTYRGAMRLAARNSNKYGPTFWDGDRELIDDGFGLAYGDQGLKGGHPVYAVLGR